MYNEKHGTSTTAAFVIGALAGGIAALLLSPTTGAQLRRKLRHNAETAGEQLGHLKDRVESVAGTMKGGGTAGSYKDDMERRRHETGESGVRRSGV